MVKLQLQPANIIVLMTSHRLETQGTQAFKLLILPWGYTGYGVPTFRTQTTKLCT